MIKNAGNHVCVRGGSIFTILLLLPTALITSMAASAAVWRVNEASTAAVPDGQAWDTAYPGIQLAVDAAASGDELWVAKGTYIGIGEQVASLKAAMKLYGGFAGAETARDQRNWTGNPTVIDGENARRCVTATVSSTVDGFTLQHGKSTYGGGMYSGTAANCTFAGNSTDGAGGGMADGAAVNCLFMGNSAAGSVGGCGGGMFRGRAINCTFIGNTDAAGFAYGGGMYMGTAVNCVIWGNTPNETGSTTVSFSCLSAATEGEGNIVGDPRFVNPWAGDFRLRSESPCVDAGTAAGAPSVDLLGRVRPQGAGIDMGAHEHHAVDDADAVNPGVLRVDATSTAASPDGLTWESAFPALQAAADQSGYGGEIWVAGGAYSTATGDAVVRLLPGTLLFGGFAGAETKREQRDALANQATIDGQGTRRCVTADGASRLDGFTLRNGRANNGGGMLGGTATHCAFTGNTVDNFGGGLCGGTAVNCTFTGNSSNGAAARGGGMHNGTAVNCAFTGNSAGDLGGGMYSGLATNCTFTGNSAGAGGGMLGGTAVNCTLTGNSALHDGGGISLGTAVNCIVWGNTPNEVAGSDPNVSYSCLSVATVGTGNITANPMFLDAGDGDLRIQPGSPCIDTGTASGAPSMDILGVPRPQGAGYDMGAYEVEVLVSVPDLSGLVRAAAREMVAAAQLYVGNETGEYHPAVPADHVIRQNPLADTEVAQWTPVDLVISKGPEPVPVPDVVGQTQDAAGGAITGIGLVVGTVTLEYSLTVPAGTVTGQTPAPGTAVLPGTSVDLVISKGGIAVPDVVGQPRALAESAITGAGLVLGSVTEVYSVSVAAGSVISQSTAAGTELPPGTAVSIVVSLGAAPVVEGEGEPVTPDAARQQLASAYATADTNGDGVLSFAEAATAMPGLTQAVFDGLDTNGDGQLSADELGVENGSGCAGCPGGKSAFDPGRCMGDLFLIGLGALGLAAMSALWRP